MHTFLLYLFKLYLWKSKRTVQDIFLLSTWYDNNPETWIPIDMRDIHESISQHLYNNFEDNTNNHFDLIYSIELGKLL